MALALNTDNFKTEVLDSSVPVLVDFWAEWCGPCKMISPLVDVVATELGDTAKVTKVDLDTNAELSREYGITSIPTLVFFKDGEEKHRIVGANVTKDTLKKQLTDLI